MCKRLITIEQIGSPIRRHWSQRATLIGLNLNRIGKIVELPDTPQTLGMIAKVQHLVRVIYRTTELDCFEQEVTAAYEDMLVGPNSRVVRGAVLWGYFEEAIAASRIDERANESRLIECVNELAVAKVLVDDPALANARIEYEPNILPSGRRIDFVVDRGRDNLYVEVKTVRPRTADTEEAWDKFLKRKKLHPKNIEYHTNKDWRGGAIYGNEFTSRSRFREYTMDFEERLAEAKTVRPGPGVLIFCGSGFAWRKSNLEDWADFYRDGVHRVDDVFRNIESHHLKEKGIVPRRNVDHFAMLRRPFEVARHTELAFPIRGPAFGRDP